MLKEVTDTTATVVCNHCGTEFNVDITNATLTYLDDIGEYENFRVDCPNCGTMEFFNMNLPPEDQDYPLELMPKEEQISRTNVRKLKDILLSHAG